MHVTLVGLPEEPEAAGIFLQELVLDLAEDAAPEAPWSATFLDDGLALACPDGRIALVGGDGFRLEIDGSEALTTRLRLAVQRDPRVLARIPPS